MCDPRYERSASAPIPHTPLKAAADSAPNPHVPAAAKTTSESLSICRFAIRSQIDWSTKSPE